MNFLDFLDALDYNCDLDCNKIKKILDWDGKIPFDYNHNDNYMNIIISYIVLSCGDYGTSPRVGWIENFKLFNEIKEEIENWCDLEMMEE